MADLVSICIPAYNSGKYIAKTLDSLINQTYPDIEIIVSDNASTDATYDIIENYSKKDNRIKAFKNKSNVGYCKNVRNAVDKATSEIIAIYHSDDIYDKNIISKEVSVLSSNPEIQGVFTKHIFYKSDNDMKKINVFDAFKKTNLYNKKENIFIGDYYDFLPVILKYGNIFPCPSFMTRRDTFLLLGGFVESYPTNEDFDLWLRYLNSGYKLAIINEHLLKYRISTMQVSEKVRSDIELPLMCKVIEDKIINRMQLSSDAQELYRSLKAKCYLSVAKHAYMNHNYEACLKSIDSSKNVKIFPLLSMYGIFQRLPTIFLYFYFIADKCQTLIRSSFFILKRKILEISKK